jgi:hypothetical protein
MRYLVDKSRVSHERLQDEVIIINMASGAYYSGSGTAADVWTLITQGASIAEVATTLASNYSCDEKTVLSDVNKCVSVLVERGVVQESEGATRLNGEFALPEVARVKWAAPQFDEYTDMWDLIQLDPIHDVDDAGWPVASPTVKA